MLVVNMLKRNIINNLSSAFIVPALTYQSFDSAHDDSTMTAR